MDANEAPLFPWWYGVADGYLDATRRRALAWLEAPVAGVMLEVRLSPEQIDDARLILGQLFDSESLPLWDDPVQMEAWLRGVVQGCAASIEALKPR